MLVASLLAVIAFGYTNAKVITRQQEPFEACVVNAVDGKTEQYALPSGVNYTTSLNVYNLDHIYIPSAVAYPTSAEQVAALVKCACSAGVAVQALSGGHSFLVRFPSPSYIQRAVLRRAELWPWRTKWLAVHSPQFHQ